VIRFLNSYFFHHAYWASLPGADGTNPAGDAADAPPHPPHVVVRYEDLLARPLEELVRVIDTCGMWEDLGLDLETVRAAVRAHPPHTTGKTGASFARFATHELEWILAHPEHGSFLRRNGYHDLMQQALKVTTNVSTSTKEVRVVESDAARDLLRIAESLSQGEDPSVFELVNYPGSTSPSLMAVVSSAGRWEVVR
jgi:hypothetical protein